MKSEPCPVCGGTELNLIDGFYYCVECGTQNVNVQETVVEHTVLADGTFAHAATRKITKVLKDGVEMSGEWHKWHAFNFILSGLVEEVMAIGGSSEFKNKVLWIWTRYMKKYVKRDLMGRENEVGINDDLTKSKLFEAEDSDIEELDKEDDENSTFNDKDKTRRTNIQNVTKSLLIAIIYIALNFDKSDIQLSHLCRFIREGRISINNYKKFIPKELKFKSIPNWKSFQNCAKEVTPLWIRELAMTVIKKLDLGKPVVPDIQQLVKKYLKELSLPNDLKELVFSLMYEFPYLWEFVITKFVSKQRDVRVPDYEGVTMTYILVAIKICFGLDDDYEIKLSKSVENINETQNYLKSYKLGKYSNHTDRLFSFREWSNFIEFRKTILSQYCLLIAREYNLDVDDQVFMGQLEKRPKNNTGKNATNLADEVTMDILNKLQISDEGGVIPRSEFPPSLTPLSTYTKVILSYIQNPDLKLLLSEDFTQYNLKYAYGDFKLSTDGENVIKGISEDNKLVVQEIRSRIDGKESDLSIVFVRNCENKHWLKTKPPALKHLTKVEDGNNKDTDHGYDSRSETPGLESGDSNPENSSDMLIEKELEIIQEESSQRCIFDDNFDGLENPLEEAQNEIIHFDDNVIDDDEERDFAQSRFNPETFDRERTIKELILHACKTYKIPVPQEYKGPTKRKNELVSDEAGGGRVKRKKTENIMDQKQSKLEVDRILSAYYTNLKKDQINKMANEISSFINNQNSIEDYNHDEKIESLFVGENINNVSKQEDVENEHKDETANMDAVSDTENNSVDLIPQINPEFDAKTHDIGQLYVQFKDKFVGEDYIDDIEDPEIDEIIEKKIAETEGSTALNTKRDNIHSDADLAKNHISSETKFLSKLLVDEEYPKLIENGKDMTEFNYWFRHYNQKTFSRTQSIKEKFDLDLKENCSKSFNFVIKECASILSVTSYSLYRLMQQLEQQFYCYDKDYEGPKAKL